jgi:cell wall-associated NlpC family hydrolase
VASPRGLRTRLVSIVSSAGVAGVVAASVVVLPAGSAGATPASDVQQQIAAAQHQLDALNAHAEMVAERYNAARIDLAAAQQRYLTASDRVKRAKDQVAALRDRIGSFAAAAYRSHGLAELEVITDSSPQTFIGRANALDQIARSQQQALVQVSSARHQLEDAQADADRALGAQKAVTEKIASDRQEIQSTVGRQRALLSTLQAKEAEIERQARLAAERARKAAERQAALREAAAAAARAAAAAQQAQAFEDASNSLAGQSDTPSSPAPGGSGGASTAVRWAYKELGKPYQWGAAGPDSFDCSGLTQYVWGKAGVYLDHYTGSQWNEGRHVSRSQLQPGDLVFFGSDLHHVGIYIGNGDMIEAPHTGANVRISPYYRSDYAGAVRPGT